MARLTVVAAEGQHAVAAQQRPARAQLVFDWVRGRLAWQNRTCILILLMLPNGPTGAAVRLHGEAHDPRPARRLRLVSVDLQRAAGSREQKDVRAAGVPDGA